MAMTHEQVKAVLTEVAAGLRPPRTPLLHNPAEAGLEYEDVFFPSEDGVSLEAWLIPREGSNKIIIVNHPLRFNRSGYPSHLEPWNDFCGGAACGNDFEINFVPDLKILHDAGYNVLAYDMRNFGHSGEANGGICSCGRFESRDVIGSLDYVKKREDTQNMTIGLFSRCLGAVSTFWAMKRHPGAFQDVRCVVAPQPVTAEAMTSKALKSMGVDQKYMDLADEEIRKVTSFGIKEMAVVPIMKAVKTPTLIYQVKDDVLTEPQNVQSIYDAIEIEEKKLIWVEGTTSRWKGYTYFQENPKEILQWFAKYME